MSFGKRLKMLRTEKDVTQLQLSEILETAKSNISKYEADTIEPNITMLGQLSKYFNVSTDYLLDISDNKLSYGYSVNSENINEDLGKSINYWIFKSGYDSKELAEKLGISEEVLDSYCSGTGMSLEILIELSKICGVSTDCLLGMRDKSRPELDGVMPFQFDPEISRRLKDQARQMEESNGAIADILGIEEEEVYNFFEYGFVPHLSVFAKIVEHFLVSSDYLLNRTSSTMTIQPGEERLLRAYRALNEDSQTVALSEVIKISREEALVAAKDQLLLGKSYPLSGTEG